MEKLIFISDNRCPSARAAAAHLISLGYRVALNDLGGLPVEGAEPTKLELADYGSLAAYFGSLGDAFFAVLHPAPPPMHATVEEANDEKWQAAFKEGALASLMITHAAGERLAKMGRGAIIYLGSIHAEKPMGQGFLYTMGCSSTQMLCREAALDYGAKGVNCFYVQRGVMQEDMVNQNDISNTYSATANRYPLGRIPESDRLNGLITFLLTEGAGALNGSDVKADEGLTLFYGHQKEATEG